MTKQFKQITKLVVLTLGILGAPQTAQAVGWSTVGTTMEHYDPRMVGTAGIALGTAVALGAAYVIANVQPEDGETIFTYYGKSLLSNALYLGSTFASYTGLSWLARKTGYLPEHPLAVQAQLPVMPTSVHVPVTQTFMQQPVANLVQPITQFSEKALRTVAQTAENMVAEDRRAITELPATLAEIAGKAQVAAQQAAQTNMPTVFVKHIQSGNTVITKQPVSAQVAAYWNSLTPKTQYAAIGAGTLATGAAIYYAYQKYKQKNAALHGVGGC